MALIYLGVRPSEAIALKWKHIDWQRHEVTISESLSRGEDGKTSSYSRQRKATKNHKTRIIELHDNLYTTLQGRFNPECKPDDLVFKTPKGKSIDDHTFSQRTWSNCAKQPALSIASPTLQDIA